MVTTTDSMDNGDEQQVPKPATDYPTGALFLRGATGGGKTLAALTRLNYGTDYFQRQQAVKEVAKANPNNIQEVAPLN